MSNKEIVSSKKISQTLIGYWLLFGIIFEMIYSFLFSLLSNYIDSVVFKAVTSILMQGFIALIVWKLSTYVSFNKKTIVYDDVPKVMKNLIIFTIVICILSGIYNIASVNSSIDNAVNSNYMLKLSENMMSSLYDDEQIAEYNKDKKSAISEVKNKAYTYLIVLEFGWIVIYLAVLPIEKKEILKYINKEIIK